VPSGFGDFFRNNRLEWNSLAQSSASNLIFLTGLVLHLPASIFHMPGSSASAPNYDLVLAWRRVTRAEQEAKANAIRHGGAPDDD
jgi:hypothetical protein